MIQKAAIFITIFVMALLGAISGAFGQTIDTHALDKIRLPKTDKLRVLPTDKIRVPTPDKLRVPRDLKMTTQGGVDSGGGGTLVRANQGWGLLDLYLYDRSDFESSQHVLPDLPVTRSLRDFGFDHVPVNHPVLVATRQQIQDWQSKEPRLVSFMLSALSNMPVYFMDHSFNFLSPSYSLPPGVTVPTDALKLGAYYVKDVGVFVSKPDFDSLNDRSKIALLVHETLRHMQITFAQNELDHAKLQQVTAILSSSPATQSFDSNLYFGVLSYEKRLKPELVKKMKTLGMKNCATVAAVCGLRNASAGQSIEEINQSLQDISHQINQVVNNTTDPEVQLRWQRVHSQVFELWQEALQIKLMVSDQGYQEATFLFHSVSVVLIPALQKHDDRQGLSREERRAVEFIQQVLEAWK